MIAHCLRSVYCLEFTPEHIITGSRDDTIKVWSQKTGRCLGTFGNSSRDGTQGHNGSVLCLKFFWESAITEASPSSTEEADRSMFPRNMRRGLNKAAQWSPVKGVLYSGSSDCSVIVWDLFTTSRPVSKRRPSAWSGWGTNAEAFEDVPEFEVRAKAKAVLRGHAGGVLDLRVDEKWIVSWSVHSYLCSLVEQFSDKSAAPRMLPSVSGIERPCSCNVYFEDTMAQ